jgi:putative ABC transport system ATP-binding protein
MSELLELRGVVKRFALGERELEVLHGVDLDVGAASCRDRGAVRPGRRRCSRFWRSRARARSAAALDGERSRTGRRSARGPAASAFGFVFQTFNLLPRMSALRNAALPWSTGRVGRSAGASAAASGAARPGPPAPPSRALSGGERQRVAIARALVNEPAVLFADEPTGNLDEGTGREILEIFRELHGEGRTIVAVTHSEEVAAIAGRVVRLRDGRVEREERTHA